LLENMALGLLGRGEDELILLGVALFVAGFLGGLLVSRGAILSMRCVPYFVCLAVVSAALHALPLGWVLMVEAAKNDAVWILFGLEFGGVFAGGILNGVLSHARSVNAYGNGSGAWMGIVPFANFVLLFKRPLDWEKGSWGRFAVDALGVVFGVVLMALGLGIGKLAEQEVAALAQKAKSDPAMQQAGIEMMLRGQGLEATLRRMAAGVQSNRVDEATTLLRVDGDGTTLRYIYEVSTDGMALSDAMRTGVLKHNCALEALRPVIQAGATIEHVYRRRDGSEIGTVLVTRQLCGY
jgi:hypothetical protein